MDAAEHGVVARHDRDEIDVAEQIGVGHHILEDDVSRRRIGIGVDAETAERQQQRKGFREPEHVILRVEARR